MLRESSSKARFNVLNPADESIVGTVADGTAEDVSEAVKAAREAFDTSSWSTGHAFRKQCLLQFQAGLRKEAAAFKAVQLAEAGICSSISGLIDLTIEEMSYSIDLIDTFAWETDYPAYEMLGMRSLRKVTYEPHGVVAAITAWNAPFMLNLWKIVPALATGNTVILKGASETPLTAALMGRIVKEYTDIPAGVFNVISASKREIGGDGLTGDPRIDMFHFTGSTSVGQRIAERAANGIRKCVLELGGKSANVILPDADLDFAIPHGVGMCMLNSGQGCTLATRMIVHASLYDEAVERLAAMVVQVPVGDPARIETVVGPIINARQLASIEGLVDRARAAGARVVAGGHRLDRGGKGYWYAPTVVVDVDQDSELAQTEVFGPVLTVIRYEGDDEVAVRIGNNTQYGLSGYVQSRDVDRAWRVARRMRTGTVSINNSIHNSADTPFGGFGRSGLGREHGVEGWQEFLQSKTIASPAA
ncbi:aldehyde dehydrogenase family protein [Hydrocarboniphaga sp.]|uniref:aldehyde dehydrogenase family protein n=1 Tax=Hydrocarboniphaga sp. TaxID=2033016 RepID=UPI00263374DB|nr:aldehyde dehydrogenase family protein [Hydrocarboniphaga sp.]